MFNDKNIVLTFSLMSDVHISGSWYIEQSKKLFINALDYSREVAKNPIDAYVFAGDFVDCMNSKPNVLLGENWGFDYDEAKAKQSAQEFSSLRFVLNNHIPKEAEIIYCLGNHDSVDCNNIGRFIEEFSSLETIGDGKNFERMYRTDLDLESMRKGMRHCVTKGYHFLCVDIERDSTETIEFLKKNLEEITAREPQKYVFVVYHSKVPNTVYACECDQTETSRKIGEILKNYSQVVLLTGHTHTSVSHEKAVMQREFTSFEGGCVSYISASWPEPDLNVDGKRRYEASEGLIFEVDDSGNIRVTRLDFHNRMTFKTPWEIGFPKPDNSHLLTYGEDRKHSSKVPYFTANAKCTLLTDGEGKCVMSVPKAEGDVFRYKITITNKNGEEKVCFISSLYCYQTDERLRGDRLDTTLPIDYNEISKVSVTALDFWENESETISIKV